MLVAHCLSMIFSENRSPLFRIMLELATLCSSSSELTPMLKNLSSAVVVVDVSWERS